MVTLRDFINRVKRYNDWMWLNWGYNLVTSNLVADKLTVTEVAALTKTLNTQNNIPQTWAYTRQCWHTGNSVIKTSNKLDAKEMTKKTKTKTNITKTNCEECTARRVRTHFEQKSSRTFQGLSRTNSPFFTDSIQCEKEPSIYVFFSSSQTWATLSWRSFRVCSF